MPSSIKLISADNVEVGTIPANSEEPFTLETLETLIDDHHKERKSFILARVETRDPALPKRSAFHYYAAHHLNKVIFRKYGPKCEYLFRLCALNPMTNTEIVGDVKYFMVDREATMVRSNRTSSHSALRGKRESRLVSMSNLMRSSIGLKKSDIKIAEISGPDAMLNDENARSSLPDIRRSSILNSSNSQQSVLKITADSRIQPTNVPMVMNSELETPLEEKEGEELGQNGLRRDTLSKNIRFAQDLPNGKLQNLNTTRKTSKSHNMLFQRQSAAPFADSKRYHSMGAIKNANTDCVKMTIRRKSLSILQPIKSLEKEKERVAPRIKFTEWMNISGSQYKAVFIGTDDDYLQKSHIRQLFEINMADGESSQLFDIPREVLEAEGISLPDVESPEAEEPLDLNFVLEPQPAHTFGFKAMNMLVQHKYVFSACYLAIATVLLTTGISHISMAIIVCCLLLVVLVLSIHLAKHKLNKSESDLNDNQV